MESAVLSLALTLTIATAVSSTLQCYRCNNSPADNEYTNDTKRLCVHFDWSDKYIVDCPYSTMCMKQEVNLKILNGETVNVVVRDCAQQKHHTQVIIDGSWRSKVDIVEPSKEGCEKISDKGERGPDSVKCFCKSWLCNGTNSNNDSYTDAMAIIIVFNLLKYVRSLR